MSDVNGLDVYLHGDFAGTLERLSQARLRFTYDSAWVDEAKEPLSLSLPVRKKPYGQEECAPFFEGLLPEGDFLKAIALTLHVSARNSFQLLTELGGECAGAISVAPAGGPVPGHDPRPPRWLDEAELAALLDDLPTRPLIAAIDEVADGGGFRLSLAGAQNKVGVLAEGGRIGLSYGMPPTTDILKAPIPHVNESVANEAFCMSLAAHIDLDVAAAHPRTADAHEYLLVHRYDRGPEPPDGRIHQEDFCQALGLVPAVKYEREGGPTVADCANLIRRHCSAPVRDITALLDALLLNFVIANHDGHSKNYSLLLNGPGAVRLAPLYDLISTAVYRGTDRKLAMRYGGENRPAYVRGRHLDRLANDLGVKTALVRRRALVLRERVVEAVDGARRSLPDEFQDRPVLNEIIATTAERANSLGERAAERQVAFPETPEPEGEDLSSLLSVDWSLADGLGRFNKSLDLVSEAIVDAGKAIETALARDSLQTATEKRRDLASRLAEPARAIKRDGREIFDGTVEFDSALSQLLDLIEGQPEYEVVDRELFDSINDLAASADRDVGPVEELYAEIAKLERTAPDLRTPVRNIRAGLRDLRDAREIITSWARRTAALDSTDRNSR